MCRYLLDIHRQAILLNPAIRNKEVTLLNLAIRRQVIRNKEVILLNLAIPPSKAIRRVAIHSTEINRKVILHLEINRKALLHLEIPLPGIHNSKI